MAVGNAAKAGPRFVVCPQILFGFLYNVLFFSIFAGLRAEYAQIEPLHWGLDPYQALIAWRIPSCSRAHGGLK
jgi:hypothetical protein